MLKGISPVLSPDLLSVLCRMGHGDEIVLADAHFPGETFGQLVLRADGVGVPSLLEGIIPLFALYEDENQALMMMQPDGGDQIDPAVEAAFDGAIRKHEPTAPSIIRIERAAFYARAKEAFAVVVTGETAPYGNIILKKGVTPPMKG